MAGAEGLSGEKSYSLCHCRLKEAAMVGVVVSMCG